MAMNKWLWRTFRDKGDRRGEWCPGRRLLESCRACDLEPVGEAGAVRLLAAARR